ncbi:MAG: sigma-70 family RNA polymerase sigma factor [bacterium]|nr:sigma-70 family RNA polymerase sigma factor [bacterium]
MMLRSTVRREIRQVVDPATGGDGTDRELVLAYQRDPDGDVGRQAASRLLARYRQRVLVWCWRVVGDRETALDAAQEVLLSAWGRLDEYDHDGRFGAWLFTIARNRCLSELRRRRVPLDTEAVIELVADPTPAPDEDLERRLAAEDLLGLVRDTLSPEEGTAVWLRCHEGLSVDAITRHLALDEKSGARGVLQRARRKLRAAVAARAGDEDGGEG